MTKEVWALVGVIVGAVLGGLAQVLADTLRARRQAKATVWQTRSDACRELYVLARKIQVVTPLGPARLWAFLHLIDVGTAHGDVRRAVDVELEMRDAYIRLRYVGPDDLVDAAWHLLVAVNRFLLYPPFRAVKRLTELRSATDTFVRVSRSVMDKE